MSDIGVLGRPDRLHLESLVDASADERQVQLVSGAQLTKLDDAKTYARKEIDQLLDITVPDAVFKRGYLFDETDRMQYEEYQEQFHDIVLHDHARLRNLFGEEYWSIATMRGTAKPGSSHLRDKFQSVAVEHFKKSMVEQMQKSCPNPTMTIETPLESPPTFREQPMGTDKDFDCALQTFAMNVASLMEPNKASSCSLDDAASLRKTAELDHPHRAHDLPWLLGSLATDRAAEALGHTIRVRTFVGADFGEIEERYIKPVKRRAKAAKFILNTMLTSKLQGANHFVVVSAANEDNVRITDPKHSTYLDTPPEVFWERWVPTNMQASLVIAIPR